MVLILYVESGTGSLTLAKNVQQSLNANGVENQILSLNELLPQWLKNFLFGYYENWCIDEKKYFSLIFKMKWFYPVLYKLLPIIMYFRDGRGQDKIPPQVKKADAIVSCSFFCAWFSSYWTKKDRNDIFLYGVLGDYTVSPGWQLNIDRLFIPFDFHSPVFMGILRNGGEITVSGIPANHNHVSSVVETGCVMLSGGGWGLKINYKTIDSLLSQPIVKRIIVLCGKNKELFNSIHTRFPSHINNQRIEVHIYTEDIQNLYSRANIVVTKAGGLTLTEAALSEKPIIINGYLPGHEEENKRFFLRKNAAIYASDDDALVNAIHLILNDKIKSDELTKNATALVNEQAGSLICNQIIKDLKYVDS